MKQTIPHLELGNFNITGLKELFQADKIFINPEYQRSDSVWTQKQKTELINSIYNCYSIGVLVLFENEKSQLEILDGQQRLNTIKKYLEDNLDLSDTKLQKYNQLKGAEKTDFDAYHIYFLKLIHDIAHNKEESIVQTFLRLQEGTPLNKAEKLNAQRGKFKDAFRKIREQNPIFNLLGKERRFRFRQLAAEILMLEIVSDFEHLIFPDLDQESMLKIVKIYEEDIDEKLIEQCNGNLNFLYSSLNYLLTGFKPGEVISFYLLLSYLRKKKADKSKLINEFSEFTTEFLKNLYSFSMYDEEPPAGMNIEIFKKYVSYKQQAKLMTSSSSIKNRFNILYEEYNRLHPIIIGDEQRLHNAEQKRTLFFRQGGKCTYCGKPIDFRKSSGHHIIAYSQGGKTDDLKHSTLLHIRCHEKIEKQILKNIKPKLVGH